MNGSRWGDTLYVEYQKGTQGETQIDFGTVDFVEHFNAATDPDMLLNTYNNTHGAAKPEGLHQELRRWLRCAGAGCP